MREHVQLDGLLFTRDTSVIGVMNQILDSFAIQTEIYSEVDPALQAVTYRRLDTVIVDWDHVIDPTCIVRATRKSSPNSNSTIVAMVSGRSETHALLVGANFMIHKPTDLEHARRCMRAAYGTMLQNRRRAARVPVDVAVLVRLTQVGEVQAREIHTRMTDLSVGGLALQADQTVSVNGEVLTQFTLPGARSTIHAIGRVVNANSSGRAGIRFTFLPEEDRNLLENWLAIELAKLEKAEMPNDDAAN
jgi:DNA-binding response OmpR family regulator